MSAKAHMEAKGLKLTDYGGLAHDFVRSLAGHHEGLMPAFRRLYDVPSDRIGMAMGPRKFMLLKHPDDVQRVLMAKTDEVGHSIHQSAGSGARHKAPVIASIDGSTWQKMRKNLAGFMPTKAGLTEQKAARGREGINEYLERCSDRKIVSVAREASNLSVQYFARSAFLTHINDEECDALFKAITLMQRYYFQSASSFKFIPKSLIVRASNVQKSINIYDAFMARVAREYLALDEDQKADHLFTSILTEDELASLENGLSLEAQAKINELIIANQLSVRTSFYWAMHNLARQPQYQDQIRRDAEQSAASLSFRPDKDGNLPLISKVIMETLRVYPPFYVFMKEAKQDLTGDNGLEIPENTSIFIAPYFIHRDPRFYSGNPEAFDPNTHFSPEAMSSRNRFSYLPFGHGPHACPGQGVVLQQMCSTLSDLCSQFTLKAPAQQAELPSVTADVFLRPDENTHLIMERL